MLTIDGKHASVETWKCENVESRDDAANKFPGWNGRRFDDSEWEAAEVRTQVRFGTRTGIPFSLSASYSLLYLLIFRWCDVCSIKIWGK